MPKTALDPFFATSVEPVAAARYGKAVAPSDSTDLPQVSSSLVITIGSGGTGITVLFANAGVDTDTCFIPLAPGSYQFSAQIRRVMATGTNLGSGGGVTALWS